MFFFCHFAYNFYTSVSWNPVMLLLAVSVSKKVLLVNPNLGSDEDVQALDKLLKEGTVSATSTQTNKNDSNGSEDDDESDDDDDDDDEIESGGKGKSKKPTTTAPSTNTANTAATWETPTSLEQAKGLRITLRLQQTVKQVTWHNKGDYFATVVPDAHNNAVLIHQLSKRKTQNPFKKSKGLIQKVLFHPSRPFFFVAVSGYLFIF